MITGMFPINASFRMNVDHEIELLVQEIKRLGSPGADGKIAVKFGILFSDDKCANLFEGILNVSRRQL